MAELLTAVIDIFLEMAPYIILGLLFVGLMNLFLTKDMIIRHIGGNSFLSNLKASLFGIPLPLCSCGVVPSSVYMAQNGASKSSVVSFLISTPQTGFDSIIPTYGMMGWVFAVFRPVAALIMGLAGGITTRIFAKSELSSESNKATDYSRFDMTSSENEGMIRKIGRMFHYSFVEFLDDISLHFMIGIIISGMIAYFVPDGYFESSAVNSGFLGMLMMIVVGIPMYICATASIPIAVTLMLKGFSPGVAFVFLAVGPSTNAASITVLTKVLGKKIIAVYLASIIVFSIAMGYLLDAVFSFLNIDPVLMIQQHMDHTMWLTREMEIVIGLLFAILIAASFYRKYIRKYFTTNKESEMSDSAAKKVKIEGMDCKHCVMNVSNTIKQIEGVTAVNVSLEEQAAYIEGNYDAATLKANIEKIGYKVADES